MTKAQTLKNEKKISLLEKKARRAQMLADIAQSKLEIAQGKYKTFKSADDLIKYLHRKDKSRK